MMMMMISFFIVKKREWNRYTAMYLNLANSFASSGSLFRSGRDEILLLALGFLLLLEFNTIYDTTILYYYPLRWHYTCYH